jgi:hypothetical protein
MTSEDQATPSEDPIDIQRKPFPRFLPENGLWFTRAFEQAFAILMLDCIAIFDKTGNYMPIMFIDEQQILMKISTIAALLFFHTTSIGRRLKKMGFTSHEKARKVGEIQEIFPGLPEGRWKCWSHFLVTRTIVREGVTSSSEDRLFKLLCANYLLPKIVPQGQATLAEYPPWYLPLDFDDTFGMAENPIEDPRDKDPRDEDK